MYQLTITIPNPAAAISLLPAGMKDFAIQGLILQPDDGASNPLFIGDSGVTVTTPYMFRLAAPAGGVPPAPLVIMAGGGTSLGTLGQLFVIGTAGEILRVTAIPR